MVKSGPNLNLLEMGINLKFSETDKNVLFLYSLLHILMFLPNLGSEILKCWRKVLMGICDVSRIISDKNPCKMVSSNS